MKSILKIVILLIFSLMIIPYGTYADVSKYEQYSRVKIQLPDKSLIRDILKNGVCLDHSVLKKSITGDWELTAEINAFEIELIEAMGLSHDILIEDLTEFYARRAASVQRLTLSSETPEGFELGSMGGMYTYAEVVSELDSMRQMYHGLVSERFSIGQSHEGRDLWVVKISDNPDSDEDEPEVLYDGLHHAGEPMSMMTIMYYMYYLLENYGSDPEATFLLDNRELYFLPVVNPDGYVYNEEQNPNGGGGWRKNRRNNGLGSYGVDLNRNYGYKWGYDDVGSSPIIYMGDYRGPSAFSEPETQAIRDFSNERQFILAASNHSYSDVVIIPWGYIEDFQTDDSLAFFDYCAEMTRDNFYYWGTANQTVGYVGNGVSTDWHYGEQTTKAKTLQVGPEIGGEDDGAWPAPDRITPMCEEMLHLHLSLAWFAGGRAKYLDYSIVSTSDGDLDPEGGETVAIACTVGNSGQGAAKNISCNLLSMDDYITIDDGGPYNFAEIPARSEVQNGTFSFSVSPAAAEGYSPQLQFKLDQGGVIRTSDINGLIIGTPEILFSDNAESGTANWDTGNDWGLSEFYYSPDSSFSDSPTGKYDNEADNTLTLSEPVSLPAADALYLEFRTRYAVERLNDFARVQVSANGIDWETQQGYYSTEGSGQGVQPAGEYGYDHYVSDWLKEQIDLSSYLGNSEIYLRFILTSDAEHTDYGWFVDDIKLMSYEQEPSDISVTSVDQPGQFMLAQNYPNPFNPETVIRYSLPVNCHVDLSIYNLRGQKVATLVSTPQAAGNHRIEWDASGFAGGVYFYRLKTTSGFVQTKKLVLLK